MKRLPITFEGTGEVKGITFDLVKRQGNVVLYKRNDGYFEVVTVRQQKAATRTIMGKIIHYEEKEIYPSGENWNGKCVSKLDRAEYWFNKLCLLSPKTDYPT